MIARLCGGAGAVQLEKVERAIHAGLQGGAADSAFLWRAREHRHPRLQERSLGAL